MSAQIGDQKWLGRLIANQKILLKTVAKLEVKIDAQAAEIHELKTTIASLRAGGRVLFWVAGTLGAGLAMATNWAWRIWQTG